MTGLKLCSREDLPLVAELARKIWLSYYTDFLPHDQIEYMLNKFYSDNALLEQINEGQQFYEITEDGKTIGFTSVSQKDTNAFFIHKLYILSESRKKNTGTRVLELLLSKFKAEESGRDIFIRLTVNRQNFKAINFYFKNGFQIEQVADFDIGNGWFMNDFVMVKKA